MAITQRIYSFSLDEVYQMFLEMEHHKDGPEVKLKSICRDMHLNKDLIDKEILADLSLSFELDESYELGDLFKIGLSQFLKTHNSLSKYSKNKNYGFNAITIEGVKCLPFYGPKIFETILQEIKWEQNEIDLMIKGGDSSHIIMNSKFDNVKKTFENTKFYEGYLDEQHIELLLANLKNSANLLKNVDLKNVTSKLPFFIEIEDLKIVFKMCIDDAFEILNSAKKTNNHLFIIYN